MTAEKTSTQTDINALAAEVMDLWQEHLSVYASDPNAKAELMRLLEPQRQLFADWAAMMQNSVHAADASAQNGHSSSTVKSGGVSAGAATAAAASDDGALRLAQLAHRTAQLEGRVAELEKRLNRLEPRSRPAPAKTARRSKPIKH